jgi:hypothetical protein
MTSIEPPDEGDRAFVVLSFKGDNLDPEKLISLVPIPASRPRRKGERMGRSDGAGSHVAQTGYCSFSTMDIGSLTSGDAHLRYVLDSLERNILDIQKMISEQSLICCVTFFEGCLEGESFADLNPDLCQRATDLGLPLVRKETDFFTIVNDPLWSSDEECAQRAIPE